MLDWADIQTIALVGRHESFPLVARELGVHPTTVARRLTTAEERTGEQLFLRLGQRLTPTAAGRRLLEAVAPLMGPMEAVAREAGRADDRRVRIAATENGARVLTTVVVPRLMQVDPQAQIELLSSNATMDLGEGQADMALRVVEPTDPLLVRRRLGFVRYGLYASPDYISRRPVALNSLAGHDLLVQGGELEQSPEARFMVRHGSGARVVLRCSSMVALASAAEQGLGLVVLPTNLGVFHDRLTLVHRVDAEIESRPVYLVYHQMRQLSERARCVLEVISEEVSAFLARC